MSNRISLTAINAQEGLPVIYRNTSCQLEITLTNETGDEISLQQDKSTLDIVVPKISADEIAAATITLDKWNTQIDSTYIQLIYTGEDGAKWLNNGKISIMIGNLKTVAQPAEENIQVNVSGFIPRQRSSQLFTPIVISNPAKPGNIKLEDNLQVNCDSRNLVYISSNPDIQKLENELLINIKNTGAVPLYTGTKKIQPRIEATFIYGNTIGCLTPASEEEGGNYAWDIHASVPYKPAGYPWRAEQPLQSAGGPHPKWVFKPETKNCGLIGTGADANVTLSFARIVAATPVGNTQVLLHFSGFWKDDNTAYDDALFMIDIRKEASPIISGVVKFYTVENHLEVYNPLSPGELEFRWVVFNVAAIKIEFDNLTKPQTKKYPSTTPLTSDQMRISLEHVTQDSLKANLMAYNVEGAMIDNVPYAITIRKCFFTDPRDYVQYAGVKLGNRIWMTQDLNHFNSQSKRNKYGCLYTWEGAQVPPSSDGWRLPTPGDWKDLLESCPSSETPYSWLISSGKSGFNATLGGYMQQGIPANRQEGAIGRYWVNKQDGLSYSETVSFNSDYNSITNGDKFKMHEKSYVSVRYVKDINWIEE